MRKVKRHINTLTLLFLLSSSSIFSQPPTLVVTDNVKQLEFHDQLTLVGRTGAWVESQIIAEVEGQVQSIEAIEGRPIKRGQPLLAIDSDRIKLMFEAKASETEQARIQAELARSQKECAEELYQQNLISETSMDSAKAWLGIQQARYMQLEADRQRLELDFKNCVISAPYNGYTGLQLINIGDWVSVGQPVFEMVNLSKIKVYVDLPERYFGHVKVGSPADILTSDAPNTAIKGKVTGISPKASAETHTFPVIIEVDNRKGLLGSGMLVKSTLYLNNKFTSLAVSKDAITRQGPQTVVFTIIDGKAAPIPVIMISTNGDMVAVTSEQLKSGMPVVVRGNERIFPGSPVMTGQEPAGDSAEGQG